MKKLNKRGNLLDVLFLAMVLLVFSVVVLISFKVMSEFNDQVPNIPGVTATSITASQQMTDHYTGVFDNVFLFLVFGFAMAVLSLAALVRVHPLFIPLFFIGLVGVIFFAGIFSNIYQSIALQPEMTPQADQLTFISNIMNALPYIIGIMGILMMTVMHKLRVEAEAG